MSDPARKLEPVNDDPSPLYREAPGNIEAEQALPADQQERDGSTDDQGRERVHGARA